MSTRRSLAAAAGLLAASYAANGWVGLTYAVQALGYLGILWGVALLVLSGPRKPTDQEDHQLIDGQEPGLPAGRHSRG